METQKIISSYVNDCINDSSLGFTTDFGVGKMVIAHVYYHVNEMVVTIKSSNETKGFSLDDSESIINWIYNKINT